MRKHPLEFVRRERDYLSEQLRLLRRGEWEVVHVNSGWANISPTIAASTEKRLLAYEELIAAYEAGVG